MAGEPPLYLSELKIADDRGPSLQPQPLPPSGGAEVIGQAIAGFGAAAAQVSTSLRQAQEHTKSALATTEYLTRLDALEQAGADDKDFQKAPGKFHTQQRELELELAGGITDPNVRATTMLQWRRAGIAAGKRVSHAALGREQDANVAALDTQIDEGLKSASGALTPVERQAAVDRTLGAITQSSRAGWITGQVAVNKAQAFGRSLSIADVTYAIRADPIAAQKLLDDPKNFPALDPVTRENFRNHASQAADTVKIDQFGELARTDPAAARGMVESERTQLQPHNYYRALTTIETIQRQGEQALDREAKDAASAARSGDDVKQLIKDGYDVDPVRVETVRNANVAAAQRGDHAARQYVQELDLQTALAPHVRRAWSLPTAMLDAAVKTMEADLTAGGANVTADQVTAYKAFKGVRDEIMTKRNAEPIVLGGENGARYYRLGPIDAAAAPDDPAFRRELGLRNGHAATAQQVYGGGANALTAEETRGLKDRWDKAGPDERFQLLRTFGGTLSGRVYEDTVVAIAGKDPVVGFVGRLAQERPELAREVLQGLALLGDEKTREKSAAVKQELASKLGGALYPSPGMQETAIAAAVALDTARRGTRGALYDASDVSGLAKALEDITGPVQKRNGQKFPITPGIPRADFIRALDTLTAEDIAMQGGAIDRAGRELAPDVLRDRAVLKPLSIGGARYAVGLPDSRARDGFAPIFDIDGRPLVFDMRSVAARHVGSIDPSSSYQEKRSSFRAGQAERIRQAREQAGYPEE